jgi:hypothetical protein
MIYLITSTRAGAGVQCYGENAVFGKEELSPLPDAGAESKRQRLTFCANM